MQTDELTLLNTFVAKESKAKWEMKILPLADLQCLDEDTTTDGEYYQRRESKSRVTTLVSVFDAGAAREIFVSHRDDGSYWILDGRHTKAALMAKGATHWYCRVWYGFSIAQEAERFRMYESNTKRIPAIIDFSAAITARDPEALQIKEVLDEMNLKMEPKNRFKMTPRAVAPDITRKIYRKGGKTLLKEVLSIADAAWEGVPDAFGERVLASIAHFLVYASVPPEYDRLVRCLAKIEPQLLLSAIGNTGSSGAWSKGGRLLIEHYRKRFDEYEELRGRKIQLRERLRPEEALREFYTEKGTKA